MKGRFITLEGGEGVGKSTNLDLVVELIETAGHRVVKTREPGGTPLAEEIRDLFLGVRDEVVSGLTELLLIFAARAQHLDTVIRPALDSGVWVVCDRFTDATYAYQGGGRGVPEARIRNLEDWVQQGLRPNLTLLLDIPVKQGLGRAGQRSAPDRFEREEIDFFERVRSSYLKAAANEPQRIRVIDAASDIPLVQAQLRKALETIVK